MRPVTADWLATKGNVSVPQLSIVERDTIHVFLQPNFNLVSKSEKADYPNYQLVHCEVHAYLAEASIF